MRPQYGHLYVADLNPRFGTEPGKVRPVVVVQTDALNRSHPSTIICPLTTKVAGFTNPLRVALPKGMAGLDRPSDILLDQIKAIDNRRLRRLLGPLRDPHLSELRQKLLQILDFVEESLSPIRE
jgi:mRNA interferase MazF